jgi:hypothetical protein
VQSSVSADANVERRSGTAIESAVVRMIAKKTRKEIWGAVRAGDSGSDSTNPNERQELDVQTGGDI